MNSSIYIFLLLLLPFTVFVGEAYRYAECQRQPDDEIIWEYDVRRPYIRGIYQEVEAEYGPTMAIITCIVIDSLSDEDNDTAWIIDGGLSQNFVKLKFRSKYSRGLRYKVFVYGQSMLKQVSEKL
ncbi:PREDICTED: uncharacterized protein LOC106786895 [Polistes canadensis]|uniref:uncharacterized protein LOC106786895 n=1 Tax=Polistes canadensis TaxID=91411 RepID=UPI000718F93B|nr:PREDICTED: uncharacterized protein LOC106786895 [Polistes canadensis]